MVMSIRGDITIKRCIWRGKSGRRRGSDSPIMIWQTV